MPFKPNNQFSKLANHKSAGRKPELTTEEHARVNRDWGETVKASIELLKNFVLSKGKGTWDKDVLTIAWKIADKHFPSALPTEEVEEKELDPNVLPSEVLRWLKRPDNVINKMKLEDPHPVASPSPPSLPLAPPALQNQPVKMLELNQEVIKKLKTSHIQATTARPFWGSRESVCHYPADPDAEADRKHGIPSWQVDLGG